MEGNQIKSIYMYNVKNRKIYMFTTCFVIVKRNGSRIYKMYIVRADHDISKIE